MCKTTLFLRSFPPSSAPSLSPQLSRRTIPRRTDNSNTCIWQPNGIGLMTSLTLSTCSGLQLLSVGTAKPRPTREEPPL
eukprot:3559048-Prymnesium_polylepis.1